MCENCGCCGQMNNGRGLISNIHSNYRRELLNEKLFVPNSGETLDKIEQLILRPNDYDAYMELGDALCYQMRYHEAIDCFEQALKIKPDDYMAKRKLAIRYLSTLQIEKSRDCFKWCLERVENKLDEQYRLAILDYYEGNYSGCIEKLQPCYEYSRNDSEMYVAVLYWDLISRVKLNEDISVVLDKYNEDIDCGHHIGYKQALTLFKNKDLTAIQGVTDHGELASSLYIYGLYHYYLYIGDVQKANETLDYMMTLDTYFSSFAFLGAFTDYVRNNKEKALLKKMTEFNSVAIGYSGGVDSTYLSFIAQMSNIPYTAYYVNSQVQSKTQVEEMFTAETTLNLNVSTINIDVLKDENITKNDKERCYFCKKAIFTKIKEQAFNDGYNLIVDGTNVDDTFYDRPGARALRELGVRSPLLEVGLTKNEIRQLMREHKVVGANKPANSCLATRIAVDDKLTFKKLKKVEEAEETLSKMGFVDFRVRVNNGDAILEFHSKQKNQVHDSRNEIIKNISSIFKNVKISSIWR